MTSVAILLSNHPKGGKAISASTNVVVWTSTRSGSSSSRCQLTYYHYHDHSHQFTHTNQLLQRLPHPVQSVHVAVASGVVVAVGTKKNKPVDDAVVPALVKRLLRVLQDSLLQSSSYDTDVGVPSDDSNTDGDAAAPETVVQYHDSYKAGASVDTTRLQSVLQQLLSTPATAASSQESPMPASAAWMQFAGDVQWQQHPEIATGLVFYLHTAGQWPTVSSSSSLSAIAKGHLDSSLALDSTAAEAIHLWPPANAAQQCHTGGTTHNNSVYGVLAAACQTPAGKGLLQQWLRQPLVHLDRIVARQDAVELLVRESVSRDAVRQEGLRLFASTDLSKLAATLADYATNDESESGDESHSSGSSSKNTRRALVALYDLYLVSSQKIPLVTERLQMALPTDGAPELLQDVLCTLQQCQTELERSVELIEAVLDLEQAPREFVVQADYKEELRDISQELDQLQAELDDCHAEMNQVWAEASGSTNLQAVRLEAASDDGKSSWQFRLPNTNDSKVLQNQLAAQTTVHRVLKNGVYFSTKQLRQLSTKQQDLRAEYDRHQLQVVLDAAAVAATYCPVLERASEAVSHLDVLTALAHTAAYSPHGYCRPIMTDSDEDGAGIELTAGRHPCVELQDAVDFIPNDCKLVFGESSFLLVTGPNMGGKSTYIRALGAIVTMAQIGSFVPCTSAKINICHHILARVGAGDLQERGISTFMAEMLESSSILRTATKRSLIIIDELGRGTSTFDGYGLARAISEYIVQKIGCMTVFATHFHELTVLEDQEKAVNNCHVTAPKGSQGLTFLYEVRPGPCLESFGIQVAEMANVPAVVIQDAKRRARELENFEYRKKARNSSDSADNVTGMEEHAVAEEASAAIAFVNRFRRLPNEVFSKSHASETEKRQALLQMLEA